MENAVVLPQGLVTIYSLDGKAEGTKKAAVQCLWCPAIGVCGALEPETFGIN